MAKADDDLTPAGHVRAADQLVRDAERGMAAIEALLERCINDEATERLLNCIQWASDKVGDTLSEARDELEKVRS